MAKTPEERRAANVEYLKAYRQRPEVKEQQRKYAAAYNQRPEVKARKKQYMQEYTSRPEVKEHLRQYNAEYPRVVDPDQRRAYNKAYYEAKKQDPEWVERRREYMRQYNARKKAERDAAKADAPQDTDPTV